MRMLARFRSQAADPYRESLLGRPAWTRLVWAAAGLVLFWLAVAWAVSVP